MGETKDERIGVRITTEMMNEIDRLVDMGLFNNRSHFIIRAIRTQLDISQERKKNQLVIVETLFHLVQHTKHPSHRIPPLIEDKLRDIYAKWR